MDFFEHQEKARSRTGLLIVYLSVAVLLIVAAVCGVTAAIVGATKTHWHWADHWDILAYVAGGTVLVIVVATLIKISEMRDGGRAVASMLGGRCLSPRPVEADERKVRNVVEEMALASGTPVPEIFILDNESGINAFAAGYTADDAVIGISRGCMERLSRDELQGVVAHEFSHILNGDMRLNIRLIGLLGGILALAVIGQLLVRITFDTSGSRSRGKKDGASIGLALVAFGIALIAIGYIGVFLARLLKSAIARQREFLADASAVQFTRNPDGLAGALKKIGGLSAGSRLQSAGAEQVSHLLFADGIGSEWFGLMASHPPLEERIRLLDPNFDGKYPVVSAPTERRADPSTSPGYQRPEPSQRQRLVGPAGMVAGAAGLTRAGVRRAADQLQRIPQALRQETTNPVGAMATIQALLLSDDPGVLGRQVASLDRTSPPAVTEARARVVPWCQGIDRGLKLPVVDLCMPALRQASPGQLRAFMDEVQALIAEDSEIDLFEFTLQRILGHRLQAQLEPARRNSDGSATLQELRTEALVVMSCLAHLGSGDTHEAWTRGRQYLSLNDTPKDPLAKEEAGLAQAAEAMERLRTLTPPFKRNVLLAAAHIVAADGVIEPREAELLRAIGDSLGCPIPPFAQTSEPSDMAA